MSGQRTEITRDTKRLPVIRIDVQPRRAAIAFSDFGPLGRILLRVDIFRILIAKRDPETLKEVYQKDGSEELAHIVYYRSTSPKTMSKVPIIATTSATNPPRTMRSSACRLTNDGGRTRRR